MKAKDGVCSECGQSVDIIPGHPRNWPRLIVANAASLSEAICQFQDNIDDYNKEFATKEFAAACEQRWGGPQVPEAGRA